MTMSTAAVPGRTFYIEPETGFIIQVFTALDLWEWPEALVALKPQIVWDSFYDQQAIGMVCGLEVVTDVFNAKTEFHGIQDFDLMELLHRGGSIWRVDAFDLQHFESKIRKLMEVVASNKDHEQLTRLLDVLVQLVNSTKGMLVPLQTDFWKLIHSLWVHRYREDPAMLHTIDFHMSEAAFVKKMHSLDG